MATRFRDPRDVVASAVPPDGVEEAVEGEWLAQDLDHPRPRRQGVGGGIGRDHDDPETLPIPAERHRGEQLSPARPRHPHVEEDQGWDSLDRPASSGLRPSWPAPSPGSPRPAARPRCSPGCPGRPRPGERAPPPGPGPVLQGLRRAAAGEGAREAGASCRDMRGRVPPEGPGGLSKNETGSCLDRAPRSTRAQRIKPAGGRTDSKWSRTRTVRVARWTVELLRELHAARVPRPRSPPLEVADEHASRHPTIRHPRRAATSRRSARVGAADVELLHPRSATYSASGRGAPRPRPHPRASTRQTGAPR